MTFSTRNNPRLGQSGVAMTSLGAVGGARGTAAGGLRILVEFLTTYDPTSVKQLEQDIDNLEGRSRGAAVEEEQRLRKLAGVRKELAVIDNNLRNRADAKVRKEIRIQEQLHGIQTKAAKVARAESESRLVRLLQAQGFTDKEIAQIQRRTSLRKRETVLVQQGERAEQRAHHRTQQRLATEQHLTKLQEVRAKFAPRLAGLAIGAVGGILGGAILGVGFQLAEAAIAKVGDALQDLLDPARHAREEVQALADAVNSLADEQKIRQIEAAKQLVETFGISAETGVGADLATLLQELAIRGKINDAIKQEAALLEVKRHIAQLEKEGRASLRQTVIDEAKAAGTYREEIIQIGLAGKGTKIAVQAYVGELTLEEAVTRRLITLTEQFTDVTYNQAQATERASQAAASASALWNVYAQSLSYAIEQALQLQNAGIDAKIAALGTGASAKTKALERQLARAQGGGGSGVGSQLRDIAEERALILLRQRLRLMGTAINLEKYSGKFLLEAINMKIAALQKEGDAQDRVNRLLDLQYRMSKEAERQQGESVADFVERRAQEQRALLQEQDDLARELQIAALEARKERLEDEIALEELAERRREALRSASTGAHIKNLQKQLKASQEADKKALEAKKRALEAQKAANERAARDAIALTGETAMEQVYTEIRGMKNLETISQFSGRMAGLLRAKNALKALVEGFGLPKWVADPFLQKLDGMIQAASARMEAVRRNILPRGGAATGFQHGGVFELNNARTPFGSNIRTGEGGTELGVVLSHNVAKILKNQKPGVGQIGPIYIEKSGDPYRDAYAMKKAVVAGMSEALG